MTFTIDVNWLWLIAGAVIGLLLKILFDESESALLKIGGNSKSPLLIGPKYWTTGTGFDIYYTAYRVRVENKQKRNKNCAAENCIAWIELEGEPEPYQICWAGDNADVTINAGDIRELEFCARGNATGKIYIPTEKGYYDPYPRVIDDGQSEIRGKLRITCMNARKTEKQFVIKPNSGRLEIAFSDDGNNNQATQTFKPLPWGTLFFGFWVTLRVVNIQEPLMIGLTWFFLALSGFLLLSVFVKLIVLTPPILSFINRTLLNRFPRLKNVLKKIVYSQNLNDVLVLVVFFTTLLGFPTNIILSWDKFSVTDVSISVFGLVFWMVAYIWAMVGMTARRGKGGQIMGIIFSICIVLIGVSNFKSNTIAGGVLIGIGCMSIIIALLKPTSWDLQDLV